MTLADTDHLDNPAGRLWLLLRDSRSAGSKTGPVSEVWALLLTGSGPRDQPTPESERLRSDQLEMASRLHDVVLLTRRAREQLESLGGTTAHLVGALTKLEGKLFPILRPGAQVKQLNAAIDPADLAYLESASALLHDNRPQVVLSAATIDGLRTQAEELATSVRAAGLAPDLKDRLLARLDDFMRALDLHPVLGAEGVARAVESAAGAVSLGPASRLPEPTRRRFLRFAWDAGTAVGLLGLGVAIGSAASAGGGGDVTVQNDVVNEITLEMGGACAGEDGSEGDDGGGSETTPEG